ncbi:MAG: amidohydrolase [Bacteroidales bacterium]
MRLIFLLITVISMGMLSSCTNKNARVDLIVHNAMIYTADRDFSIAGAVAIKDGRIVETGSGEDIMKKYGTQAYLDAHEKYVYPGFIDAHCHFLNYGLGRIQHADLTGTSSFEEVLDAARMHHEKQPGEWIVGRGWDQNDWPGKEFPSKEKLDEIFPDIPVILTRIDGHAVLVNSEALERAGIDSGTKVQGGEVVLANGQPTGILIDNAINFVTGIVPEPGPEMLAHALREAEKDCFAVGLTSVTDAGLSYLDILLIDSLQQKGELKMRINAMLTPTGDGFEKALDAGPYKTGRLQVNSIKLYADGALGSRGAALLSPYSDDPGNYGMIMHDEAYYADICRLALENNYQVCTHAIGDSANRFILDLYSGFLKGPNDRRWRIEHAQVVHPEDMHKFGDYGIIPSIQATHATSDMYWAGDRLGPERILHAYAFRELLQENGWIPNGTDFPIEKISPLLTFYASVARKDTTGYPYAGFQKENALTREEALRSVTVWAARGSFREQEVGSLETGKYADFVILDRDIMKVPEHEIPDAKVLSTYQSGERVW